MAIMASKSRTILAVATAVPVAMFGLGFAAKPLYDAFCKVTGFGGTVRQVEAKSETILDRQMQIRFDASHASDSPLKFRPLDEALSLKLGQTGLAYYQVTNLSDRPVSGIAGYNVIPHKAGRFFSKLECFCFERRVFEPGQTYRLPVVFFVDPALDSVPRLDDVRTITLSYTLHADAEALVHPVAAELSPLSLTGEDAYGP